MTWFDLSTPIVTGMDVFPGDPEVSVRAVANVDDDAVAVSALTMGTHTGTHVDAPAHTVIGGRTVDDLTLNELCGVARVIPVHSGHSGYITATEIAPGLAGGLPARVLLCADAASTASQNPDGPNSVVDPAAAQMLWDAGARLLGINWPSADPVDGGLAVHRLFLGGDGVLVENLHGLERVVDPGCTDRADSTDFTDVELMVLPLLVAGGDGAPARVVCQPISASKPKPSR